MAAATKTTVRAGYTGPYADLVNSSARANGLDPWWLAGLLWVENRFKPTGASPAGAEGIAQIELPAHPEITKAQADNPAFAIPWAARYLASLKRGPAKGSIVTATAMYNTGPAGDVGGAGLAYVDQVRAGQSELKKLYGLAAGLLAGGFLRPGSLYKPGRSDRGQDFQTNPGAPLIAPGDGKVLAVKSDPGGFGPSYPIVQFTTGPYADAPPLYLGHTLSALPADASFKAGQVLSHTGTSPIGNASVAGWAEIGYAPGSVPGKFGQVPPFYGPKGQQVVTPGQVAGAVGDAGGAVTGAAGRAVTGWVGDLTGWVKDNAGNATLWLLFMLVGFALLYLGVTRLFGVRPVSAALGAARDAGAMA